MSGVGSDWLVFRRIAPEPRRKAFDVPGPLDKRRERTDTIANEVISPAQYGEVQVRIVHIQLVKSHVHPFKVLALERSGHVIVVRGHEYGLGLKRLDCSSQVLDHCGLTWLAHLLRQLAVLIPVAQALCRGKEGGRRCDELTCTCLMFKLGIIIVEL